MFVFKRRKADHFLHPLQTLTVLNPFARIDQHLMDDSDLYGALLYIVLYGTFLLLSGKVFYGYIYGVAVFGTVVLHLILSLMSPALIVYSHNCLIIIAIDGRFAV